MKIDMLQAQGCLAAIGPAFSGLIHRDLYRQRHRIENLFQRTKVLKRISTRYEKFALTFFNFVLLATIFDWLKSF